MNILSAINPHHIKIGLGISSNSPESFVELDGQRLNGVREITVHSELGQTTSVTLKMTAKVDIEGTPGKIEINHAKPQNMMEAIQNTFGYVQISPNFNDAQKVTSVTASIAGINIVNRYDDVMIDNPASAIGVDSGAAVTHLMYNIVQADIIRKEDGTEYTWRNGAFERIE